MNELIKEAIMERFDELFARAENLKETTTPREQARGIEQILKDKIPENDKYLFNEWLDLHVQIVTLQEHGFI